MKHFLYFLLFPALLWSCSSAGTRPVRLTCEYMQNPSVVDETQPRLAWIAEAPEGQRGQQQTAWQVRVASSKEKLSNPDLWDSQKVESDQCDRVPYGGAPLASRQECWWQVRLWDRDGAVSAWSEPAFWRMGLLDPSDWQASWIGAPWQGEEALPKPEGGPAGELKMVPPPAPMLRKGFSVDKKVARAVVFTTGLGYFELYLNGQKVGDDVLVPNTTNYGKRPELPFENIPLPDDFREYRVMYLAYDVKDLLQPGENVLGSILGNGFYNTAKYWTGAYGSPRFIAQLHITYTDGTEDLIASDVNWKASKSPILFDMLYYGEHYDARLEQPGWAAAGFDDSAWEPVAARKAPEGKMTAHTAPTDQVTEVFEPVRIEKTPEGTYRVDFGVEISGWLKLQNVTGPEGHKLEIKYNANQYSGDNSYIFRGGGPETYAARFNWFVFSGVEILNWPGELRPEHLRAEMVNTWVEESAEFETSNPLFNDINKIWRRSQVDNMHAGIASDCPHRERAGYTGDGQVACVTVMHNYDARPFYQKWIRDMRDAQIVSTGYVPNGAPWQPGCGGGVAWGAAINIMPWEFYLHYGARDMLEDNYEAMKGYVQYMQTWVDADGIMFSQVPGRDGQPLRWFNLGDWSMPPGQQVPDELVHTFYFWRSADLTAKAASALGKADEARRFEELAQATAEAFHRRFFDEVNGSYGDGGGNIFALKIGVPADRYERVCSAVRANLEARDGHLDTGIFGTQFLFEVLSEHGMHDLAYGAINKRTEPSYGYWLEVGSTTTREDWDNSGSHNHPMFGGGLVWFYRVLAGMQADPERPGYRHIVFRPQPAGDVTSVKYSNLTPQGRAGIAWQRGAGNFSMVITVPVGSTATVYVPVADDGEVTESGASAAQAGGVRHLRDEPGYSVFEVESGVYRFGSSLP
jgi:alpha-L-rhamnosidase